MGPDKNISLDLTPKNIEPILFFEKDPDFKARLKGLFPLFGLKWCLICLNEFISTGSERLDFSQSFAKDKTTVRRQQLLKAKGLSTKIKAMYKDGFQI